MSFLRRLFGRSSTGAVSLPVTVLVPEGEDAIVQVVGEGNYQDALRRVSGGKTPDGPARPEQLALLIPEPNNRYDRNAISIRINGQLVGYLSRENAIRYRVVTSWANEHGRTVACQATLTGGWDRGSRDEGHFGVLLHLGSPAESILGMLAEEVVVRTDHPWGGHLVAFTGESRCYFRGFQLDREGSTWLARRAGIEVHPRVTKKVTLLVDCDPQSVSGNERKAVEHQIPVVAEVDFWRALGLDVTLARP